MSSLKIKINRGSHRAPAPVVAISTLCLGRLSPCSLRGNAVFHQSIMTAHPSLWIALAALTLGLSGCGKPAAKVNPGHPLPASHRVSKCQPGQPGGRFVLALTAAPKTFNPLFAFDAASDNVTRLLNASLVHMDWATQEPAPGLAESWTVGADSKTWTLKLRQGVRWSDGIPLTAADVVFTWNEIMYDRDFNPISFGLFQSGGKRFEVSALDEFTVRVVTPEIFAPFLEFFGTVPVLPKHALEQAVKTRRFPTAYGLNTPPERIVGCGPYRVKQVEPGKSVLLERNPDYWVADAQGRRLPYLDEVLMVSGGGPGSDTLLFLNGKNDACDIVRFELHDSFQKASADGRVKLLDLGVGTERDFLWFNQNTGTNAAGQPLVNPARLKWFRDKKFRQAVSCAIDRDRIAREVYAGHALPIHSFCSTENQKWNAPDVPRYGYDLNRARALLAEAGLADRNSDGVLEDAAGTPAEISFFVNAGNPGREKAALLIRDDLGKVGIKLVFQAIEFRTLIEKINRTFDYECALMGLGGGGSDPASQINVLRSTEELHQWFPRQQTPSTEWEARVDALMDAQMRTLDFSQRKKGFDEVQVILAEQLPMIYTVSPLACAAIRADVGNVRPSVLTSYRATWNLEELYFTRPAATTTPAR